LTGLATCWLRSRNSDGLGFTLAGLSRFSTGWLWSWGSLTLARLSRLAAGRLRCSDGDGLGFALARLSGLSTGGFRSGSSFTLAWLT
jgi:hypothetical protein